MKDEDVVWLYRVFDTSEMGKDELQKELDKFSNSLTPHEIAHSDGHLLVVRFQSALTRNAYLKAAANTMSFGA
ncbi:hypothetical protein G8C15_05635 [Enterococcus casseliflavus]|nr:hypothetical protein [Enterococcus casseliflavus]